MMGTKNIIAVVGATGAQGGGLVRAILADQASGFAVRALTRDVHSDKAAALRQQGAEVVVAYLVDFASVERAFAGAYGAFCLTNFWEHFSPEKELAQATAMAHAAKNAGLQHVIWSTLEDTRRWVPLSDSRMPTLMGHYKVPHFDAKGEADQVFLSLGVPTTLYLTSFYWENMIFFGMGPKKGPDGKLAITMPMGDKKLPGVAVDDIGAVALGIFTHGRETIGKTIGVAGEHLTGTEMATALTQALGREIRYNAVPPEVYAKFGFPGAEDLANMFQFKRDFPEVFCGARTVEAARRLYPGLQTFSHWLVKHKHRIPLEG